MKKIALSLILAAIISSLLAYGKNFTVFSGEVTTVNSYGFCLSHQFDYRTNWELEYFKIIDKNNQKVDNYGLSYGYWLFTHSVANLWANLGVYSETVKIPSNQKTIMGIHLTPKVSADFPVYRRFSISIFAKYKYQYRLTPIDSKLKSDYFNRQRGTALFGIGLSF